MSIPIVLAIHLNCKSFVFIQQICDSFNVIGLWAMWRNLAISGNDIMKQSYIFVAAKNYCATTTYNLSYILCYFCTFIFDLNGNNTFMHGLVVRFPFSGGVKTHFASVRVQLSFASGSSWFFWCTVICWLKRSFVSKQLTSIARRRLLLQTKMYFRWFKTNTWFLQCVRVPESPVFVAVFLYGSYYSSETVK